MQAWLQSSIDQALKQISNQGYLRSRKVIKHLDHNWIDVQGKRIINFASNDYLGLAAKSSSINDRKNTENLYGATGSAYVSGYSEWQQQLECKLSEWLQRDNTILCNSGFLANLSVISTLIKPNHHVFIDKRVHASIIDAVKFSGARFFTYQHQNFQQLAQLLDKSSNEYKWIITESVFSMDGSITDLHQLKLLADAYHCETIIDEAHALGVMGPYGNGLVNEQGLSQQDITLVTGMFGKALGAFGGFVSGHEKIIEYILQTARPNIYTTALPPIMLMRLMEVIDWIKYGDQLRHRLNDNINYFIDICDKHQVTRLDSHSAIQGVLFEDCQSVLEASQQLWEQGFWVPAMRWPTVPKTSPRLRIIINASHSKHQISQLVQCLAELNIEVCQSQ